MSGEGPAALFFACLVSGILVPLPEDVALLVAGWQVGKGDLAVGPALLAGVAGTLARDLIAFGLGAVVGPRLERLPAVHRFIGEARLARAHALFEKHGRGMLFWTRFAVGLRAPLYFAGGSLGFPLRRFLGLDLVGLAVSVPLTLWMGQAWGEEAAIWLKAALSHQRIVLTTIVTAATLYTLWRFRGSRGAERD
jgi:membrane protein DedA with SNARE-associated domain